MQNIFVSWNCAFIRNGVIGLYITLSLKLQLVTLGYTSISQRRGLRVSQNLCVFPSCFCIQDWYKSYYSCSVCPVSDALCTLCPDWPVYSAATFPATVLSLIMLDLKERATTNDIKLELEQKQRGEAVAELLPNESHAAASVSLLAKVISCSFNCPIA